METIKPIRVMIHDLNPWGGQDRSMLEIAWQLNKKYPLEIHSYSLDGYSDWPDMEHIKYETPIKRPIIFKYLNYHFKTWSNLKNDKTGFIQSTGTASLKSNVVQVQFIHHSWLPMSERLPNDKSYKSNVLKKTYHLMLNQYKLEMEKKLYTPEKHYIAISHGIKKELMHHFNIPSGQIEVIHHGVDHTHFTPASDSQEDSKRRVNLRKRFNVKEEDTLLLHVGALNSRKGIFKALQSLSFLKKNGFNNLKYMAVGQGDTTMIKDMIKDLSLEEEVILAPHSKDIREYYQASDIFFFPSLYEPFGLVALEAMACGLPSVVSSLCGAAELITDQENGVLFDPNDSIKEISNTLVPLLKDKSLQEKLGKAGRKTAENRSWEQVGLEYQAFYNKLHNC